VVFDPPTGTSVGEGASVTKLVVLEEEGTATNAAASLLDPAAVPALLETAEDATEEAEEEAEEAAEEEPDWVETIEVEVEAAVVTFTPHCPTGLSPGNFSMKPKISSSIAELMLHVSEESLIPPMIPGHLSIPESPASQLSMIC